MSNKAKLISQALILGSGPDNPKAAEFIDGVLNDFVHETIESQRIDLGGRTIVAILIAHDPAHGDAIRDELEKAGPSFNLDIGMLEVS